MDAVELVVLENGQKTLLCVIQVFSNVTVGIVGSIFTLQDEGSDSDFFPLFLIVRIL